MAKYRTSKPWLKGLKPDIEQVARNFVMYSQCSGHFVPEGIDHIYSVLVMPTHRKLVEPCQIYCYEDNNSEVRKFGISKDHKNRAKQTKRKAEIYKERFKNTFEPEEIKFDKIYDKFLWYEDCLTRSEAICIEALLKKELIVKKNINNFKKTGKAITDFFGIHINTIGSFSGAEITDMSGDELKNIVFEYKKEWIELKSEGFLRKYFADECNKFDEDVRKIINGEYKFTCEVVNLRKFKNESTSYREELKNWKGNIYYKNQNEPNEDHMHQEIPIENIPEIFYEIYNFSLILDRCWS